MIAQELAGPERASGEAGPGTALGDEGMWLDSVELLDLVVRCELEFGVRFPGADLNAALATVGSLADLVRIRRAA